MGATGWNYFAAYQSDPKLALAELQNAVFWRREYTLPPQSVDDLLLPHARGFRGKPSSGEQSAQVQMELRVKRAIETGDYSGLSPAIRSFASAMRERGLGTTKQPQRSRPRPKSIAEVLEQAGESGTHSILDIVRVSKRAAKRAASPLALDLLTRAFDTDKPTHELVEQRWEAICEELPRWQARYFVVYRDAEPSEYAFIGATGD